MPTNGEPKPAGSSGAPADVTFYFGDRTNIKSERLDWENIVEAINLDAKYFTLGDRNDPNSMIVINLQNVNYITVKLVRND